MIDKESIILMTRQSSRFCLWSMASALILFLLVWPHVFPALSIQEGSEDQITRDNQAKMEKQRRDEAFNKLKEDTEKFYQAAGELKDMIEKSSPHTYSLQIVKKTEDIEKMLKEIRRRAKEGL